MFSVSAGTGSNYCHSGELRMTDVGSVNSPNFPSNYPNDFCQLFRITGFPPLANVQAFFNTFDLERDYDFLSIGEVQFTGNKTGNTYVVRADSNGDLLLKFSTDDINTQQGFDIDFKGTVFQEKMSVFACL